MQSFIKFGRKLLTDPDLGRGAGNQTHIGLISASCPDEQLSNAKVSLIYDGKRHSNLALFIDLITRADGSRNAPKVRKGNEFEIEALSAESSVCRKIRDIVNSNNTNQPWHLGWTVSSENKMTFYLCHEGQDIWDEFRSITYEHLYRLFGLFNEDVSLKELENLPCAHQLERSLLTKPFTILTGASGTGKTKLAETLASYYSNSDHSNSAIVAVGADWTDNRSTLGFVNHLTTDGAPPIYQSTEILNLILRANKDAEFPYFLILDEMNLSHVERYFADFLSVMEQKDGKFHLHDERDELGNSADSDLNIPSHLLYPQNLFVIGTVNIDETTYMFSPKVLDRANVIEFKVAHSQLKDFLDEPKEYEKIEAAVAGQAELFLQLATNARANELTQVPSETSNKLNAHLLQLFDLMQEGRFEFAYRSANEIVRYMRVCYELTEDKDTWKAKQWETNFDEQIVQKILPKLHGSIGRIGKLIATLAHFCHNPDNTPKDSLQDIIQTLSGDGAKYKMSKDDAKYKKSFAKLQSMASTLREEQFVSFIH